MKSTPILYSPHMVRAHLRADNPKTQTRRLVKPQPYIDLGGNFCWDGRCYGQSLEGLPLSEKLVNWKHATGRVGYCPYGQPGDEIWAKETFRCDLHSDYDPVEKDRIRCRGHYTADNQEFDVLLTPEESDKFHQWRDQHGTKPSLFMFRSLSRIVRTITDVRVQRLQDISEKDAEAEGVAFLREHPDADETLTARQLYKILWNALNMKPKPVYGPGPDGKPKIQHYVSYPWQVEDLDDEIAKAIQAGSAYKHLTVTEKGGTYIVVSSLSGRALHITPNPWVWALTYR